MPPVRNDVTTSLLKLQENETSSSIEMTSSFATQTLHKTAHTPPLARLTGKRTASKAFPKETPPSKATSFEKPSIERFLHLIFKMIKNEEVEDLVEQLEAINLSCEPEEEQSASLCIIAWALIKKGSYTLAFKNLTTAAAFDESSPMVAYFCGVLNEKRHFNNRAIENFKKCIKQLSAVKVLDPQSKILHALGRDNLNIEAERHINDLSKKSLAAAAIPQPIEESQINQLVWQIERRGLVSKTIEVEINELKKIVSEHPDSISAKKALIKLFQKNGIEKMEDWELALSQLEAIMSSCPSEVEPILSYCVLFQKIQIAREVRCEDEITSISDHIIHYLTKAAEINSQDYRPFQMLSNQYWRKKDYLFSRECLKRAMEEYLKAHIVRKGTTVEWYDDLKRLCSVEDPNSSLAKFIVQKIESNPLDSDLLWIFNHIFNISERNPIQEMSSMLSDRALLDLEEIENDPSKQISENYKKVQRWIDASLAIKPYNPSNCYYALSMLYKLEGKTQEQEDALEKSYSSCPSYKCEKELTNLGYSRKDLENLITKP